MTRIGIDIGGTHIRVGVVSTEGRLLRRITAPTRPERGPDATTAAIVELIHELLSASWTSSTGPASVAIGVGVSGPVDIATGIVTNPHTLAGWPPTDLKSPLQAAFPEAAIAIENDANVASLGEWWVGAGRGTQRFVLVTIGTGIGVGLLVDGEIQRASGGSHGEAGHLPLDPSGPRCYCGASGCWESLASGTVLNRRLNAEAFDSNNPRHQEVLQEIARWIGLGLVTLCATVTPDRIAIGGGVGRYFDRMHDTIIKRLHEHRAMIPVDIPVCAAVTGDDAGVIGAAFLAGRLPKGRGPCE